MMTSDVEHFIICLFCHLYIFPCKVYVRAFYPFFKKDYSSFYYWVIGISYIFWVKFLCQVCVVNIFSQSMAFLFICYPCFKIKGSFIIEVLYVSFFFMFSTCTFFVTCEKLESACQIPQKPLLVPWLYCIESIDMFGGNSYV